MKKAGAEEIPTGKQTMERRTFLKVTGAAAGAVIAGGLAGVLEAQRAPAYAQARKLHILQFVDFVPEGDGELRRQVAEKLQEAGADPSAELQAHSVLAACRKSLVQRNANPQMVVERALLALRATARA